MKTKKRTQPISSLDLTLPTSWAELTSDALHVWAALAAATTTERAQALFFLHLAHLDGLTLSREGVLLSETEAGQSVLTAEQLAVGIEALDFLTTPPTAALSLDRIGRYALPSADMQGVAFGRYLRAENCFQGFLATHNTAALADLVAAVTGEAVDELTRAEEYLSVLWYGSVKVGFAALFPDLFRPSSPTAAPSADDLRQAMDAQIRALTGGDITKEAQILKADTWRALTELNAKAREANEFKNQR